MRGAINKFSLRDEMSPRFQELSGRSQELAVPTETYACGQLLHQVLGSC